MGLCNEFWARGEIMETYFDLVRYGHILSGITWIGLLYYFNFIQVPSFAQMDAAARSNAVQFLVPRALLWFRWSALFTVIFWFNVCCRHGGSRR